MDIEQAKDNYDKNGKPRCFSCNIYEHTVKDCRKLKKIKNRNIQEDSDDENKKNNNKEASFVKDSE